MADGGVIRIGSTFDTAQLKAAFDEAGGDVQKFVDALGTSFEQGRASSQRAVASISEDTKTLAANLTTEYDRMGQATRGVSEANAELRRTSVLLRDPTFDQAEAARLNTAALIQQAAAQRELNAARASSGIGALAGDFEHLAESSHKAVTDMQATSAAIRTFEGNAGIRAVEAFVSKTLGLGPLIQTIFPLVGALAFTDVLVTMGEKLFEFGTKAETLSQELGTDWLTGAIGQLNGLEKAVEQADAELQDLAKDMDSLADKGRSAQIENIRLTQGPAAADRAQGDDKRKQIAANQALLADLKNEEGKLQARSQARTPDVNERTGEVRGTLDPTADALEATKQLEVNRKQQTDIGRTNSVLGQEADNDDLKADKEDDKPKRQKAVSDKGNQELLRSMEEGREAEEQQGKLGAKADHDYWEARIGAFSAGSAEYHAINQKITRDDVEGARAATEAIKKARAEQNKQPTGAQGDAAVAEGMAAMKKFSAEIDDDFFQRGPKWNEYWKDVAKGSEIVANLDAEMSIATARAIEAAGGMSKLALDQKEAAVHAQEHAARLAALREELERLQAQAAKNPLTGKATDPKQAAQIAQVQNQITQEQGSTKVQAKADVSTINRDVAKPYLDAFNQIDKGWLKVQNDLIQGNHRIGRDFAEIGLDMVQSAAASAEKIVADMARSEIRKLAAHTATARTSAEIDEASAATSDSVSALSAIKQLSHSAAVAAGNAWAALSSIPIVGPELGAVAAAATYAGVIALAAFDVGTNMLPTDMIAMVHAGERIVPAADNSRLISAVEGGGGGGGGGDMHLHMGGNSFSSANGDFHAQFEANQRQLVGSLKRWHREGKLNFASN